MKRSWILHLSLLTILGVSACAPLPQPTATETQSLPDTETVPETSSREETPEPDRTETASTEAIPVTGHLMTPAKLIPAPVALIHDVESAGTSAPYGDSYRINRFERPFLQDMTYVPELDILRFEVSEDKDWYYVSIVLNGNNLNSALGIHYGAEIDVDADGFGDFIIWASPSYTSEWATDNVQIFEGNGYDTQIFDGGRVQNEDPDLAWVRMAEGEQAVLQLAFKKSWVGASFVVGVVSDAGIKDVSQYDYNDRFEASQAGSPLRNDPNYPLGLLYAVDNTCWQPYNLELTSSQPKFCPPEVLSTATRRQPSNNLSTVVPPTNFSPTSETPMITPPTSEPPTSEPPTSEPPTSEPPTEAPPTACTPTFEPPGECDYYDPTICDCGSG